jgi:excisionase family DNA binding protein
MMLMARNRDNPLKRIQAAFQAHRKTLEELEEALLEGFENQSQNSQQLLTIRQVCQELSVGRSWVYDRIKAGEMPSVQMGGTLRIKREDLDEYVNKNHRAPQGTE